MLGLKLPTDPRWVNIVEKNIEEILTDHAFCEQKATSTAISLIVSFPEYTELVQEMVALVKEEISHFKMVHDKIIERGWTLGRDRRDDYVLQLVTFFPKGGSRTTQLVHRLLYAALIVDAVYVPFHPADFDDFLTFADALDVAGASVTVP
ncbi:MAG: tRNA isopentenyl-2-thiomethyl-A-37 hydroxylase MiaE, partial [Flavobacteriales bacterium]